MEIRYTSSVTNPKRENYSGTESCDLLGRVLDNVFQSMHSETLHQNEHEQRMDSEEELHTAEKQHPLKVGELLTQREFPAPESSRVL